ncbi:MAG TPA: tetratricopeptide repeat protein, partial [Polyangiaceae bacterium]|nr:tetratricopeptide repeat protein [Polyangiaceae bacterium]
QIYEGLCEQFARDVSVKVNLALCYLKTGQPEPARRMLQDAVRLNPEHKRAWGYLGLALQKLGDVEQAQIAFERGGHAMMARRLTERRSRSSMGAVSQPPELDDGIRSVAETAFSELDAGELRFALAEPASSIPREGPWHTLELGEAARPKSPYATTLPPAAASTEQGSPPRAASPAAPGGVAVRRAAAMPALLVAPAEAAVTLHPTGVLLVRVAEGQSFAGRLDALRAVAGKASTRVLHRRSHEADTPEVLGGVGSPLVRVEGAAQVVLGARAARELALLTLDGEAACVREDTLFGFELRLEHESRRVPLDADAPAARSAGEGAAFVQLRGSGALVVELAGKLAAIPHPAGGPLLVRREWLVGWLGHLLPRALPAAESPNGQRGLVAFSGEGSVLVSVG